ncbi:MAG: alpha/beta fold hydrolase [Actinobacteria bacterium]|nr:alpha/beta fold hydrolase [Actinomycetota bacterium]
MGNPELLAYLGTGQAVHDFEVFRQAMGYGKVVLYGQSYGTSFAQTYAVTYPEAVERLVLDGTIDLTRDGIESRVDRIKAFEDVLSMVFDACDQDRSCTRDMGMRAGEAYQGLLDRLEAEPATVRFPIKADVWEDIPLTVDNLGYLALSSVYYDDYRMKFVRALTAATSRDDLVPMMRLGDLTYGSGVGPTMMNMAVTCLDFSVLGDDADAELEAISVAWDQTPAFHRWLYMGVLPCVYWPHVDRTHNPPGPFRGERIPTLIVAAEADPTTPYSQSVSVSAELDDGYLLTVRGGSHVMFGRGVPCIDMAVTEFILNGTKPTSPACDAEVISPYAPLFPDSHTDLGRGLAKRFNNGRGYGRIEFRTSKDPKRSF